MSSHDSGKTKPCLSFPIDRLQVTIGFFRDALLLNSMACAGGDGASAPYQSATTIVHVVVTHPSERVSEPMPTSAAMTSQAAPLHALTLPPHLSTSSHVATTDATTTATTSAANTASKKDTDVKNASGGGVVGSGEGMIRVEIEIGEDDESDGEEALELLVATDACMHHLLLSATGIYTYM